MLTTPGMYLGNVSFGSSKFLDTVAEHIGGPMNDYKYNLFPTSSFGNDYGIDGDFKYSLFPYPAPNSRELKEISSSFGKKKKTSSKGSRKFLGYVKRPSGSIVKVYQKKDNNGKLVKVLGNNKKINVKKVFKTKTKAKSG